MLTSRRPSGAYARTVPIRGADDTLRCKGHSGEASFADVFNIVQRKRAVSAQCVRSCSGFEQGGLAPCGFAMRRSDRHGTCVGFAFFLCFVPARATCSTGLTVFWPIPYDEQFLPHGGAFRARRAYCDAGRAARFQRTNLRRARCRRAGAQPARLAPDLRSTHSRSLRRHVD